MAVNIVNGGEHRIELPAGGTFSAGDFLKISSNTVVVCTDGVQPCGIALNDGASTDTKNAVVILAPAVVRVTAGTGVNFAPGDACYVQSAQVVDTGSQGNYPCGYVVNTDPSTAGEVVMDLLCSYTAAEGTAHA